MSRENGGQAFPQDKALQDPGMTLRDYFAATATDEDIKPYLALERFISRQRARYMHADGMLVERAR